MYSIPSKPSKSMIPPAYYNSSKKPVPNPQMRQDGRKPVPPSGKRPMPGQGSNKPVPPSGKRPQVMTGGGMLKADAKVMAMKEKLAKKKMQ